MKRSKVETANKAESETDGDDDTSSSMPGHRRKPMSGDLNPYDSSAASSPSPAASARKQLLPVAIALLVPSILHIFGGLFFFAYVYMVVAGPDADPEAAHTLITYCLYYGVSMLYSLLLVFGSISLLRTGSYLWAFTVCILAAIPFFGPCYILAVPGGLWGIVVLRRPEIRELFSKT
jgi:hypothetical protein